MCPPDSLPFLTMNRCWCNWIYSTQFILCSFAVYQMSECHFRVIDHQHLHRGSTDCGSYEGHRETFLPLGLLCKVLRGERAAWWCKLERLYIENCQTNCFLKNEQVEGLLQVFLILLYSTFFPPYNFLPGPDHLWEVHQGQLQGGGWSCRGVVWIWRDGASPWKLWSGPSYSEGEENTLLLQNHLTIRTYRGMITVDSTRVDCFLFYARLLKWVSVIYGLVSNL